MYISYLIFLIQENGKSITILDIEADPSALKNLDMYILLALFECKFYFN